jgi:hypothetical protein
MIRPELVEQLGGEPTDQPVKLHLESSGLPLTSERPAWGGRIANTVADSSTLRRDESRSPAQVCRSCPSGNLRSRSRRPSGALATSACSRDGPGPELDRLSAGCQQHPDGFPVSAAARLAEAHTGERLPGRSHSVDIVALHPATTRRPLRPVDLNDPLAARKQCRSQSGTETAGAFDGPQSRLVAPPEDTTLNKPSFGSEVHALTRS